MMKQNLLFPVITTSLLGLLLSLDAQAAPTARITQIEGKVFVSTPKGYVQAQPGMILDSGNRVMTLAGSSARVTYPDNCSMQVGANSLFIMGEKNQCTKDEKKRLPRDLPDTSGAGSGTAAAGTIAAGTAATIGGIPTAVIGIGAVVIGTGTAIIVEKHEESGGGGGGGNQPISPE